MKEEQLTVQLAGCSVAALGGAETAKPGDYGWSPAYQDVLDLRLKYDETRAKLEASYSARDLALSARDDWKSQAVTFKAQRDEARKQVAELIEKQRQVAAAKDTPEK